MNGLQNYITSGMIQGLGGGFDDGLYGGVLSDVRKSPVIQSGLSVNLDASNPINRTQQLTWVDSVQGFNVTRQSISTFLPSNGGNYFLGTAGAANFVGATATATNQLPFGNSPRTMQGWFNVSSYSSDNNGTLVRWGTDTGTAQFFSISLTNVGNLWLWTGSYNYNSPFTIPLNKWVNIACIHDGVTTNFAVNGIWDSGITPRTYNTQVSNLTILGRGLTGNVSKVLIYNRALTRDEVMFNYTSDLNKYNT